MVTVTVVMAPIHILTVQAQLVLTNQFVPKMELGGQTLLVGMVALVVNIMILITVVLVAVVVMVVVPRELMVPSVLPVVGQVGLEVIIV